MQLAVSLAFTILSARAVNYPAGRFSHTALPQAPGFEITDSGFRALGGSGDEFQFSSALTKKRTTILGFDRSITEFTKASGAQILDVNLVSPGLSLYFDRPFELTLRSSESPRLSWAEATVNAPNPTAPTNWSLITFADEQPPVLLVFESPVQLVATGKKNQWKLGTVEPYRGWVRARLPIGLFRMAPTANNLGVAMQVIQSQAKVWLDEPKWLKSVSSKPYDGGEEVTFRFSGDHAQLPTAILMAVQAGYAMPNSEEVLVTQTELEDGPQIFAANPSITLRFPMRSIEIGVPIFVGIDEKKHRFLDALRPDSPKHFRAISDYLNFGPGKTASRREINHWAFSVLVNQDSRQKLDALWSQIGILAESSVRAYRTERGWPTKNESGPDEFAPLRQAVFSHEPGDFFRVLSSPVRLMQGPYPAVKKSGAGYSLTWTTKNREPLVIQTPWPIEFSDAKNIRGVIPSPTKKGILWTLSPSSDEPCEVMIQLPKDQVLPQDTL